MFTNMIQRSCTATLFAAVLWSMAFVLHSCSEEPVTSGSDNNQQTSSTNLEAPSGVTAKVSGKSIIVSWNAVSGASKYVVYVYREHWKDELGYLEAGTVTGTSFTDKPVYTCNYYYKVKAVSASGNASEFSSIASCYFPNGKPTGGNDDEPGGGDDPGDDDGQDDDKVLPPSAPTGVRAENYGSALLPEVRISWNPVSNATSYKVYRSRSASGTYSQIGSATTFTFLSDFSPNEGTNYYKVKAVNSAGSSPYSSSVSFTYDPETAVRPCPVKYGNCTVSGSKMTLRWTVPTSSGCGKPDKAYLRVRESITGDYVDLQTLSGTATSASFTYTGWIDNNGYVYVGIITENAKGTSGGVPKVYDTKNKRWIN